jgi:hypothetical protein
MVATISMGSNTHGPLGLVERSLATSRSSLLDLQE